MENKGRGARPPRSIEKPNPVLDRFRVHDPLVQAQLRGADLVEPVADPDALHVLEDRAAPDGLVRGRREVETVEQLREVAGERASNDDPPVRIPTFTASSCGSSRTKPSTRHPFDVNTRIAGQFSHWDRRRRFEQLRCINHVAARACVEISP